jgi:hypothetical protein
VQAVSQTPSTDPLVRLLVSHSMQAHHRQLAMKRLLLQGCRPDYPAEAEYRGIVGDKVYGRTVAYLKRLPKNVDRVSYFRLLAFGVAIRLALKRESPEWCRRRDKALRNLRTAIDELKTVLRDSDVLGTDTVAIWAGGLEREFCRLTEPLNGRPSLLTRTPKDAGRSIVGRPVSAAKYVRGFLGKAGVPAGKIGGALRAAGLDEPTPRIAER